MILCICLSPALDVTYLTDGLTVGGSNRVTDVMRRPGGKTINVARVLRALGEDVHVLAPVGGTSGAELVAALADLGVDGTFVSSGIPTRQTVAVVHGAAETTIFLEPSVIDCWPEVLDAAAALITMASAVVIGGVLPQGVPADAFGTLIGLARQSERPVIVDTSGDALANALAAGPTMAKPNADELTALTGDSDSVAAARMLASIYATTVIASLGARGVVAATPDQAWTVRPARALEGNPTGAGDALVAGLARTLSWAPRDLPSVLRDAVALSAAAVLSPVAGDVELAEYEHQRAGVVVEAL